ncbi:hypothetical protein Ddye_018893, partial [Dipteronia dyeriana]
VKKSETIENLKVMLREKEGILENNQDLYFSYIQLRNGGRISDYNIRKNSVVRVNELPPIKIYVKWPSNKKTLEFKVNNSDTIDNIKRNIRFIGGFQSKNYSLYYAGKLVEDGMTAASLEIQNGATLQMVTDPNDKLSISVETPDGGTVDVEIRCCHTAVQVKEIVESLTNLSISEQIMTYAGEKLEDCKTLDCYNIKDKSMLELLPPDQIQIFVKTWSGKTITFDVQLTSTIKDIKHKLFDKFRIPFHLHSVVFAGKRLEENRVLASYNVQQHSTLHMLLPPDQIQIFVKSWSGKTITLDVQLTSTIKDLKHKLFDKLRIPFQLQSVVFAGKRLEENW